MKKDALSIYSLVICFVATIAWSIGFGVGIYSFIGMKYPDLTIGQKSLEISINNLDPFTVSNKGGKVNYAKMDEAEKKSIIAERTKNAMDIEKRKSYQAFVGSVVVVTVSMLVFIPHWLIARHKNKKLCAT